MIYELVTLLKPENTPTEEAVLKVKTMVKLHGGELVKYDDDGKVRMNYELRGHEKCHRIYYILNLPSGETAQKISGGLNADDDIMRHLLVRAEKQTQEKYGGA